MNAQAQILRAIPQKTASDRERLARMGYNHALPAVLSLTRDNRLYEREDVKQQVWIFVLEAIDKDKGLGDILYYIKWYTINRIRDWIGMVVRRHAFMTCDDCGCHMHIKPTRQRVCPDCGAGADRIESKSFVDTTVDYELSSGRGTDDHTPLFVEEFLRTLKDDRDRDVLLGYVTDVDRAQLAVRHGVSTGRISQIINRLQSAYTSYATV